MGSQNSTKLLLKGSEVHLSVVIVVVPSIREEEVLLNLLSIIQV
jgi:hypothetical protein